MMPVLADLLSKQPYFEECSQTTIDLLAVQALHRQFAAGEAIFHEGDPAIGLWLVGAGSIKIFKVNPDGIEHILHFLGAGSTFID